MSAEEIELCKAEGQVWGFRLTGGIDFGSAITIIKVTKDGVAERAGMRVGDMLLKINDIPLLDKSHQEATDFILDSGNRFKLTICRGSFELPPHKRPPLTETAELLEIISPISSRSNSVYYTGPLPLHRLSQLPPFLASMIAEGLEDQEHKEEPQVLAGEEYHDASKDGVAAESAPADPAAGGAGGAGAAGAGGAEGADGEKPHIEYTEDEIAEMMSGCAEVLMGKCMGVDFQKLPPDTDIMKSEVLSLLISEKMEKPEKTPSKFNQKPERPIPKVPGEPDEKPPPYNPLKYVSTKKKPEEEVVVEEPEPVPEPPAPEPIAEPEPEPPAPEPEPVEIVEVIEAEPPPPEPVDQPEEPNDIESQLAEIQRQLAIINKLPIEIQQNLNFVQEQLAKILALRAAEAAIGEDVIEEVTEEEALEEVEPVVEGQEGGEGQGGEGQGGEGQGGEGQGGEGPQEPVPEEPVLEPEPVPVPEPEPEPAPEPKHKKDIQWKKAEEEDDYKRKPFFPLTPIPRPVRLPGGRTWFAPRDVYTEDFIAETISGKEEVIIGTTIGVDFNKFERNYDHLKSSSVYQMVHHEDQMKRRSPGIFRNRAEKDHAKEDYVNPPTPTNEVPPAAS